MLLEEAKTIADRLVAALADDCVAIQVAGSIRREKPEVKDIEIVALPHSAEDLFGGPCENFTGVKDVLFNMIAKHELRCDPGRLNKNATKYFRYLVPPSDIALDLFLADKDNFGSILAIRTGPGGMPSFSQACVTQRRKGGLLPNYLKHEDGYLWALDRDLKSYKVSCSTEQEFFDELGIPWIEPREREAWWKGRMKT
jgi:DNA polymerase/3'-5' exonuclease PolX